MPPLRRPAARENLAALTSPLQARLMFLVDNDTAIAVRRAYMAGGEDAAATALHSVYQGIDRADAERCAKIVLSWPIQPERPATSSRATKSKLRAF